jgi:hypothetical protein
MGACMGRAEPVAQPATFYDRGGPVFLLENKGKEVRPKEVALLDRDEKLCTLGGWERGT